MVLIVPLALILTGQEQVKATFWLYVALAGVIQYFGFTRAVKAYTPKELSAVAPFGALTPLLLLPISLWVLHEHFTWVKAVGAVLIVAGAFFMGRAPDVPVRSYLSNLLSAQNVRTYLMARLIWVPFPIVLKLAIEAVKPLSPYFISSFLVGTMCLAALPRNKAEWREAQGWSRKLFGLFVASMCIVAFQQYVEIESYAQASVALVSAAFKVEIPMVICWMWIIRKIWGTKEEKYTEKEEVQKEPLAYRLALAFIMAGGAFLMSL